MDKIVPKTEFIATGSELMSGATLDRNFSWAADLMISRGIVPSFHSMTGDNADDIVSLLDTAYSRADVVIVSGGLGPTEDDLTASAAASYFDLELEYSDEEYSKIEAILDKRGRKANEKHKKMAFFPVGSRIIPNSVGVAAGFCIKSNEKSFYFLPGIPAEYRAMFSDYVIEDILSEFDIRNNYCVKVLKTFGLPESEVSARVSELGIEKVTVSYRLFFPEVHVRLIAGGDEMEDAESKVSFVYSQVRNALGEHVYNEGVGDFVETVADLLASNNFTVSAAESCTGGMLSSLLTDIPGSSGYFIEGIVAYSNQTKTSLLGVPSETIASKGAVSADVVRYMAKGVRKLSDTDIGIGISGIAGPGGGTEDKPVGTVFVGIDYKSGGTIAEKFRFSGTREEIKCLAAYSALNLIRKKVVNNL